MKNNKKKLYKINKKRYLNKIIGNKNIPRLSLFKSNKQIYGQLIDDNSGYTLSCFSTLEILRNIKSIYNTLKKSKSYFLGKVIANILINLEIKNIKFDKGNKSYKGLIKILSEGLRNYDLEF